MTNGNTPGVTTDTEAAANVLVTEESIQKTIDGLEDEMQKDFIRKCLRKNPEDRPTARELLFHPVLFEVHSLKLLAAHILVNTPGKRITSCIEIGLNFNFFFLSSSSSEVDTSKTLHDF